MDKIIPFHFQEKEIRIIQDEDGTPWWVAKDVCLLLGFGNPSQALANHLDEDEKGIIPHDTPGGKQDLLTVNESGLYALIFKSSKPEARPFRKWVTSEVLPSIRKNGSFSIMKPGAITPDVAANLEATIKVAKLFGYEGNQALFSANKSILKAHGIDCMDSLEIKALEAPDKIQYFTPTLLGKKIGLSPTKFNLKLEAAGLQRGERDTKNRRVWVVTEEGKLHCQLLDTGKKTGEGTPVMQIKWAESVIDLLPEPQEVAI